MKGDAPARDVSLPETRSVSEKPRGILAVSALPKRIRLQILCSVILFQAIVLLQILSRDKDFAQWIANARSNSSQPFASSFTSSQDPALQSTFAELPKMVQSALPKRRSSPFLLVPVGDCASCLGIDLRIWSEAAQARGIDLILMSKGGPEFAKQVLAGTNLQLPVVLDQEGRLSNRLNAAWAARPYLFSSDGLLTWYSHERQLHYNPFMDSSFVEMLHTAH